MSEKEFQKWAKVNKTAKTVISKVIENLGPNIDDVRYEITSSTDIYISTLYYMSVKFKNKKGQDEELSMILKRPTQMEAIKQLARVDPQFHNEILFYRMYAQPDENFAKCFYADERPPIDSVIALENVSKRKYHSCPCKCDPPLEYTLAAVREIGRFHGKGYAMKQQQREKFFDIVEQIQEARYDREYDSYKFLVDTTATRAVDYLRDRGHDAIFCDKMESLLSNAFDEVMMKTVEPLEPLSTLCHGDFTLANVLFKKEDDGEYRAMLIDFALLRYGTPVIDLSTYLCVSCPTEVRKDKFFEIMRAYHGALEQYLLEAGVRDIEKYSYDALLDDYKRGALFGFLIITFYLPTLLGHIKFEETAKDVDHTEIAKYFKVAGGDEISEILGNLLLHLKDLGCLQHVL
ncbi:uncharacterized protein [Linepithema humile]|uniref:uncharacterized protein n=1 Tax=Linepithema humile TaxID=83485 RepID=UPI0006231822|nr:PREDICTED: uncharacterized protein LOC105678002 [Linepithema humile]